MWKRCANDIQNRVQMKESKYAKSILKSHTFILATRSCVGFNVPYIVRTFLLDCDDFHGRIQRGDRGSGPPPWKITKYRVSEQYWSRSTERLHSYQASIHCWGATGSPAKRHLRFAGGPMMKNKTLSKFAPSGKIFWIRAWFLTD